MIEVLIHLVENFHRRIFLANRARIFSHEFLELSLTLLMLVENIICLHIISKPVACAINVLLLLLILVNSGFLFFRISLNVEIGVHIHDLDDVDIDALLVTV